MIAAIAALMLFLLGCGILLGLRHMKLGEHTKDSGAVSDVISLQGFVDTPNYRASAEWADFLAAYDPDGSLLAAADTDDFQEPMEYMAYICYTQEMLDKIDAICDKYDLDLLGPTYLTEHAWQVFDAVGISGITAGDAAASFWLYDTYFYRSGSFSLGGEVKLLADNAPWNYPVHFQYRCVVKTDFDGVALTVGDIGQYEEWYYTLQDGTTVLLALSDNKALIIADLDHYFATVNILNPSVGDIVTGEHHMDRAALETVADTFTFSYTLQKPDPDTLIPPEWFTSP